MATKKPTEPKVILEREYIVPLRKQWLKVPSYKRAPKAVKALKQFIARHMKLYDDDLRKVKIDITLNNELRFRGIKKPPARIRVRATKLDNDTIRVQLAKLPDKLKFKKTRDEKKKLEIKKKVDERKAIRQTVEPQEKPEQSEEAIEKEQASKEETQKIAKEASKELKHTSSDKKVVQHRKALAK